MTEAIKGGHVADDVLFEEVKSHAVFCLEKAAQVYGKDDILEKVSRVNFEHMKIHLKQQTTSDFPVNFIDGDASMFLQFHVFLSRSEQFLFTLGSYSESKHQQCCMVI